MAHHVVIYCRCGRDGLIPPPPFEKYVVFGEVWAYEVDNDLIPSELLEEADMALANWERTACEHEDMELLNERLCGNDRTVWLKEKLLAIEECSNERFSCLLAYLPNAQNGAYFPVEKAAEGIIEIDSFLSCSKVKVDDKDLYVLQKLKQYLKLSIEYNSSLAFN